MASEIKRFFCVLLIILVTLTPLISSAIGESNVEVLMPYDQFSLIEAPKPDIPNYPFSDNHTLAEESEAVIRFNEWWNAKYEQQAAALPNLEEVQSFTRNSAEFIFANIGNSNVLYSPISIWFYLELLSNLTEGNSRQQVFRAMGLNEGSKLYNADDALYKGLYWDDGFSIWRPASSLWIDQRIHLSDALVENLVTNHHTSVFQGLMGEDAYDEAFRAWLNEQTNSLMRDIVKNLRLDPTTGISLCTSLYLRCSWSLPFSRDATYQDVFYTPDGEAVVDFMKKEESGGTVYQGAGFSSVIIDLQDGGYVTLVLPDLNKGIEDILASEELYDFLFACREWGNAKNGRVKIFLPKLDIMIAMPLKQTLMRMGVVDVFDPEKVEFSSDISSDDSLALSSVDQYSRLVMNEDGIEAASIMVSDGSSLRIASEEEIEFTLNRPFLFTVFSETSIPLFIGVCNTP